MLTLFSGSNLSMYKFEDFTMVVLLVDKLRHKIFYHFNINYFYFASEKLPEWPVLYLEVLSLDMWERYRTEGYGYTTLPIQPGEWAFL